METANYIAIAKNIATGKLIKENLDSFNELQEFAIKMEKRGFLRLTVTKISIFGQSQTLIKDWDGERFVTISK